MVEHLDPMFYDVVVRDDVVIKGHPALQKKVNSSKEKKKHAFREALRDLTKQGQLHINGVYGPPHPMNVTSISASENRPLVVSFIAPAQAKRYANVRPLSFYNAMVDKKC